MNLIFQPQDGYGYHPSAPRQRIPYKGNGSRHKDNEFPSKEKDILCNDSNIMVRRENNYLISSIFKNCNTIAF